MAACLFVFIWQEQWSGRQRTEAEKSNNESVFCSRLSVLLVSVLDAKQRIEALLCCDYSAFSLSKTLTTILSCRARLSRNHRNSQTKERKKRPRWQGPWSPSSAHDLNGNQMLIVRIIKGRIFEQNVWKIKSLFHHGSVSGSNSTVLCLKAELVRSCIGVQIKPRSWKTEDSTPVKVELIWIGVHGDRIFILKQKSMLCTVYTIIWAGTRLLLTFSDLKH